MALLVRTFKSHSKINVYVYIFVCEVSYLDLVPSSCALSFSDHFIHHSATGVSVLVEHTAGTHGECENGSVVEWSRPSFRKYRTGSTLGPSLLRPRASPGPVWFPANSTLVMVSCRPCCPTRCRISAMIDGLLRTGPNPRSRS